MKNLFKSTFLFFIFSSFLILQSCKDDSTEPLSPYSSGILVCNEGAFGSGTGTITHYDPTSKTVTQDVFNKVNGFVMGNILQSVHEADGKLYWVINNANKIEMTDASTLKSAGAIEGIPFPRYMVSLNGKGYVSSWGDGGNVHAINLTNLSIIKSIPVGNGPEQMQWVDGKLYVALSGGFGNDHRVAVINTTTNTVEKHIEVGANPSDLVYNGEDKLWVLCSGKWKDDFSGLELPGSLYSINTSTKEATLVKEFASEFSQPSNLIMGADKTLYFCFDGQTWKMVSGGSPAIFIEKEFYSLGLDKYGQLLAGDAGNFTDPGMVYIYDASSGEELDSFQSGIIPTFSLSR